MSYGIISRAPDNSAISGRISARPDTGCLARNIRYPAGYRTKKNGIIRPDIRPAEYPVHPYFKEQGTAVRITK